MDLERLRQDVRNEGSAIDAAVIFIAGLVNRLRAALSSSDLQGEVDSLADELEQHQAKLATAIAANTDAEDDSANVDVDHGPIDDSQTATSDGSPTVDPTQQPAGGEPTTDSNAGADPVADTTTDTSVDSQDGSDQADAGAVPADNTTLSEPPVSGDDSVTPAPADEPGVAADDSTQPQGE